MVNDGYWWFLLGAYTIGKWEWMDEVTIPNDSNQEIEEPFRQESKATPAIPRLTFVHVHPCNVWLSILWSFSEALPIIFSKNITNALTQFGTTSIGWTKRELEQRTLFEKHPPLDFLRHHVYLNCRKKYVISYNVLSTYYIQTVVK